MGDIERYLKIEGEQPTLDDLPASSRAADVRTALAMVDREREMRESLRHENARLKRAIRDALVDLNRGGYVSAHATLRSVLDNLGGQ